MSQSKTIIAEAVRCEVDEDSGKFYIVFEVLDPVFKLKLKKEWVNDIEFEMVGKTLTLGEE